MKKVTVLFVILVIMIGCSSKNETESQPGLATIDNKQLVQQANDLDGYWLTDAYLKKIEQTKSIYPHRNYNTTLYGFVLDKDNLLSDSAYLNGFTEHEGGYGAPLLFNDKTNHFETDLKRKQPYSSIEYYELITTKDGLVNFFFPKTKKIESYRKVVDDQTELRKILFEGNYVTTDSTKEISFERTGKLKGWKDKIYFEVVYDFGEGIEYDAILFFNKEKGGNWSDGDLYKYQFNSDTLNLYPIHADWETLHHTVDPTAYTLIKK